MVYLLQLKKKGYRGEYEHEQRYIERRLKFNKKEEGKERKAWRSRRAETKRAQAL